MLKVIVKAGLKEKNILRNASKPEYKMCRRRIIRPYTLIMIQKEEKKKKKEEFLERTKREREEEEAETE